MSASIDIDITALDFLNLPLVHCHAPLIRELRVTNRAKTQSEGLIAQVTLTHLAKPIQIKLPALPPGASWRHEDIALQINSRALHLNESLGQRQLEVKVHEGEHLVGGTTRPVEITAYNCWRLDTEPHTLAAQILPTHPRVLEVAAQVDARLAEDRAAVAQTRPCIRTLYQILYELHLRQTALPDGWESTGICIASPEQLLHTHQGNSLDLAVFSAALAERLGLRTALILLDRHALIGFWVSEIPIADLGSQDSAALLFHVQMGDLVVLDPCATSQAPPLSFEAATKQGADYLAEEVTHRFTLDLQAARQQGYRPLPAWVFNLPDTDPDQQANPIKRPRHQPVQERIRKWQAELLDLTLRNRLLHFNVERLGIPLTVTRLAHLEDLLVKGRSFEVLGTPRSETALTTAREVSTPLLEPLDSGILPTPFSPEVLDTAMIRLERKSRASFEEAGDHTLFLALGLLRWVDLTKQPRCAPLLMVPIALQRRTNRSSWKIARESEATVFNPSLIEKLRADYAIDLTCFAEELPGDDYGIDVAQIFGRIRAEIQSMPQWRLEESALLGHFSFTKQVMWRDLERLSTRLDQTPILSALTDQRDRGFPEGAGVPAAAAIDCAFPPESILCPLDADASQLAAVLAAAGGESFILQGPPGTGKSQTITNLITHCLAMGKTVLFVAAKMAALSVVHKRLQQCQVDAFCLELHSHAANKKMVVDQLGQALDLAPDMDSEQRFRSHCAQLADARARLNGYCTSINQPHPSGWSARALIARMLDLAKIPRIGLLQAPPSLTRADLAARLERIGQYATRVSQTHEPLRHPLRWVNQTTWTPFFQEDFENHLEDLRRHFDSFATAAEPIGRWLALDLKLVNLNELRQLLEVLLVLAEIRGISQKLVLATDRPTLTHELGVLGKIALQRLKLDRSLMTRYQPALYHLDLRDLLARLNKACDAFALVAWWMLRGPRRQLRAVAHAATLPSDRQLIEDLQRAQEVIALDQQLDQASADLQPYLHTEQGLALLASEIEQGTLLIGKMDALTTTPHLGPAKFVALLLEKSRIAGKPQPIVPADVHTASQTLYDWLTGLTAKLCALNRLTGAQALDELTLADLLLRLQHAQTGANQLRDWCLYLAARTALEGEPEAVVIEAAENGQLAVDQLAPAFERAYLFHLTQQVWQADPNLHQFDSANHERILAQFRALDRDLGDLAGRMAQLELRRRVPAGPKIELDFLRRELNKKIRHPPIRRLFEKIPSLRQRLKPCMLMSPLSVAQYLTPDACFDIVIFDEASQIPTADAVGAIARGRQLIVVGDSKQLPPTRFFERAADPENDRFADQPEELESILDECRSSGMRELRLDWHYRSQHEHLIAFSNSHYYDGRLQTFPSADNLAGRIGVSRQPVPDGAYQRGARVNPQEAQAVVAEVIRRLESPQERQRSLGIVTFSAPQQALIEDLLEVMRYERPDLDLYFGSGVAEPIFVKNLENVQGDERDVILFSICYGPDEEGKVWMNFGPLNQDGGERRLNVAVTRARQQLIVFSTLTPDKIDLKRTRATGVKHLRLFLEYAERGPSRLATVRDAQGEHSIEARLQASLKARGHHLTAQLGCSDYRIDLAIHHPRDPRRLLLGIECDGSSYASAKVARDRDRLRQELLVRLGWRLHRVWTADWWTKPEKVLEGIERELAAALGDREERQLIGANAAQSKPSAPAAAPANQRATT